MKRKIYLALILTILAMLLCACAESAATEAEAVPAGKRDPSATPYVRLAPRAEGEIIHSPASENTAEAIESYEEFVDSFYDGHVGNFRFHGWELEMFQSLDQTEPYSFTLHQLPGVDGDELIAAYSAEQMEIQNKYLAIESEAAAGKCTPADSSFRDNYPGLCTAYEEAFLAKMPEEWFELRQAENELGVRIMERRRELDREYAIASAKELSDLGLDAQVWAMRGIDNGEEYYSYICTVTASPEKLWEAGEMIENMYFIEQLYESVRLRHDIPVELGEGG